jgi:hypothetical protein
MSDEELLRAYRPAGPPPELRARIVSAPSPRLRDWLPALAAAALIVLFGTLGYRLQAALDAKLTVPDDRRVVEQWISPDMEGLR